MYAVILKEDGVTSLVRLSGDGPAKNDYLTNDFTCALNLRDEIAKLYPDLHYSVVKVGETGEPVKSLEKTYTQSQVLALLASIGKHSDEILPVRDGFVARDSKVWWHSETGPQQVIAGALDWDNIREYPEVYSIEEPDYEVVYKY